MNNILNMGKRWCSNYGWLKKTKKIKTKPQTKIYSFLKDKWLNSNTVKRTAKSQKINKLDLIKNEEYRKQILEQIF